VKEPVLEQLTRRKCNWLGHTMRRSDDSTAKQALHRKAIEEEGIPVIPVKVSRKKLCRAGYRYSWGRWRWQ